MILSAKITDISVDYHDVRVFRSKEAADEYFREYAFSYYAEISERGNLVPAGIKRAGTNHIHWLDEE